MKELPAPIIITFHRAGAYHRAVAAQSGMRFGFEFDPETEDWREAAQFVLDQVLHPRDWRV